jgi:hypothetical protein
MDKIAHATAAGSEAEMPADLLAGLLMERASAASPPRRQPDKLPASVYGVMVVTTVMTFATLTTGYQMLFAH